MTIYFVNKTTKIKGPYGITDANRNRLIKIGDICVRENAHNLTVLLITEETNSWQKCKCIGCISDLLGIKGNSLLFTFNGISQRQGNIAALHKLSLLFEGTRLGALFTNAVDILLYKCDLWDISTYYSLFTINNKLIPPKSESKSQDFEHNYLTIFEAYLNEKVREVFIQCISEGMNLKQSYTEIRKKYPQEFRKALKVFLIEYPNSSIYDKEIPKE